jgi:hypothetical protein
VILLGSPLHWFGLARCGGRVLSSQSRRATETGSNCKNAGMYEGTTNP